MKKSLFIICGCFAILLCLASTGFAAGTGEERYKPGKPSSAYAPSSVVTELRVDVDKSTDTVHFVRDNSDPYVVTKAYPIKNADPFAVRGYLLNIVNATTIEGSPVSVEAAKYNDGSAVLMVSAEQYRFTDNTNGESIDSIVARLDRKDLTYSPENDSYLYLPKVNHALTMKLMLEKMGLNNANDGTAFGTDIACVDGDLNALVIRTPSWNMKSVLNMLRKYDVPVQQVRVNYRVYEVYTENDDRIGVDFQSWKNNDGVDLFCVGARYRRNWSTLFTGNVTNNGTNSMNYWDFNPKWNTRYLDFLAANGSAKIVSSGVLMAMNKMTSHIKIDYGFFYDATDLDYTDPNVDIIQRQPITKIMPENVIDELAPNLSITDNYWRMLGYLASEESYQNSGTITDALKTKLLAAGYTQSDIEQFQYISEALNRVYVKRYSDGTSGYTTDTATAGIIHGKLQIPMAQEGFKLDLEVTPVIQDKATQFDFKLTGISMIGNNSDGTPRLSNSEANTHVQILNSGKEFVIDDIEKVDVVRSVAGMPLLKDIPFLGWLFCVETESTKKSRMVVVISTEAVLPNASYSNEIKENVKKIVDKVEAGWKSPINNMGFQQYWFDTDELK